MLIINLTDYKINRKELKRAAKKVLAIADGAKKLKEISVVFVGPDKIRAINKKYRSKNAPTDVLSFEGLNEIFICPAIVARASRQLGEAPASGLNRILAHGILHLLGYDHEKSPKKAEQMRSLEERAIKSMNF